ncbi:hypothetical protein BH18ACT4_BH18ACT4_14550 [soil metagenome]
MKAIRRSRPVVLVAAIAVFLSACHDTPPAPEPNDFGYPGPSFAGAVEAPSGEKPESKLWWNDGFWWSTMFDTQSGDYHIFRLQLSNQRWVDTGTALDPRPDTKADALWDGSHLYVASHVFTENSSQAGSQAQLRRYSYDAGADRYTLDTGFPQVINNVSSETLVIDKDSTGRLWATWVGGGRVNVTHTTSGDRNWRAPFVLPPATSTVSSDDISSVIAFKGDRIGIMWSDQSSDDTMFVAEHHDLFPTDSANGWSARQVAYGGPGSNNADDHINLQSLHDVGGRIFAAIKTSSDPLVLLLARDPSTARWSSHVYGRDSDGHTRPIIVIDAQRRVLHMFATATSAGGTVYRKTTSIDNISFPSGRGDPVIRDADGRVNNPASTKQVVNSVTGLVVIATNDGQQRYWHHHDPLSGAASTSPSA